MNTVAIIDYGLCNLGSVARAIEKCCGRPVVTDRPEDVASADRIVLPGVGAYADAMARLRERGLIDALRREILDRGAPFLGICLGMQLAATRGTEGGPTEGLGLVPGEVVRLVPDPPGTRIPHVGWNEVDPVVPSPLFDGIGGGHDFYFTHSYHLVCPSEYVIATTPYCGRFVSAIGRGKIFAVQFHPEKSQRLGLRLLETFLGL